jgi:hypothetical protein
MDNVIPAWIIRRYKKLWGSFDGKKFTFEDAKKVLEEDDEKFVSVVLSELDKLGWIDIELDPEDRRKRLYTLKPLDAVIKKQVVAAFGINEDDLLVKYDKAKSETKH